VGDIAGLILIFYFCFETCILHEYGSVFSNNMKSFLLKEILRVAWISTKEHWGLLLGVACIIGATQYSISFGQHVAGEGTSAYIVLTIVGFIITLVFQIGLLKILLNCTSNKETSLGLLVGAPALIVPFFLATLTYVFVTVGGLLLLIVPGIVWALRYCQWSFVMVEKKVGVREAFKRSAEITYGYKKDLFKVYLMFVGVIFISILPVAMVEFLYTEGIVATEFLAGIVALLFSPFFAMVAVHIYRFLSLAHTSASLQAKNIVEKENGGVPSKSFAPLP
jgi:hypothetical protein